MIPVSDLTALAPFEQEAELADVARDLYAVGENAWAKIYLRASFAAIDPPGALAN